MSQGHHGMHHAPPTEPPGTTTMPSMGAVMSGDHENHHPMTTGSMDHMMKMYFHFGFEPIVLFEQWSAQTVTGLFFTCLFYFSMAILYEFLKAYRRVLTARLEADEHHQGLTRDTEARRSKASIKGHVVEAAPCPSGHTNDPSVQITAYSFNHPSYGIRGEEGTSQATNTNGTSGGNHGNNNGDGHSSAGSTGIGAESSASTAVPIVVTPVGSGSPIFATLAEMFTVAHLWSTLLYALQVFFAYFLMLAFMLFNAWICLAIILGAATGHFLLAHRAITLQDRTVEDYCH